MTTSIIYEPRGRAREYAPLACAIYSGCAHRCFYCYVPGATDRDRKDFHQRVGPRPDILKALERDAKRLAGDPRPVLMSFSTDPYQPIDAELRLTREAIKILHRHALKVHILTKGGRRSTVDFDLLGAQDAYAASLTYSDEAQCRRAEPGAAPPAERIAALEEAKARGIPTWASLEPVVDPSQALDLIRDTIHCVDHYKIGAISGNEALVRRTDWRTFVREAVELLEANGKSYYLKDDLRRLAAKP